MHAMRGGFAARNTHRKLIIIGAERLRMGRERKREIERRKHESLTEFTYTFNANFNIIYKKIRANANMYFISLI